MCVTQISQVTAWDPPKTICYLGPFPLAASG